MPIAATHRKAALHYAGQFTPWLQAMIDASSQGDLKSAHRFVLHDYETLQFIKNKFGHDIGREALLHMILDLEQYRTGKLFPIPLK